MLLKCFVTMAHYISSVLLINLWITVLLGTDIVTFKASTNNIIRTLPYPFIGFNLDFWKDDHEHFGNSSIPYIDFQNKDLIALTSAISPAMLRIGGSGQDSTIYDIFGECSNKAAGWNIMTRFASNPYYCSEVHPDDYYCLTSNRWHEILEFCDAADLKLIFGMNACYGRYAKDEMMNMSNIDALLSHTASHGNELNLSRIYGFEFGNGMSGHIDSQIYSYDLVRMHTLIARYFGDQTGSPLSIGTDNNYRETQFVEEVLSYLPFGGNTTLDLLNWHQYTNCHHDVESGYVFSADCLSTITQYPAIYTNILEEAQGKQGNEGSIKMMIGESALDHSGGIEGESNVFLSSFYFMFQLGELSKVKGMDLVQRQSLSGGYYGLLDTDFRPMPDYWLLYLWRMLIGDQVLDGVVTRNENVTGYGFTGKSENEIVVVLINFSTRNSVDVELDLKNGDGKEDEWKFEEYHMSGSLNDSTVFMNSMEMIYENGRFPQLQAKEGNGTVTLSAASICWIRCLLS